LIPLLILSSNYGGFVFCLRLGIPRKGLRKATTLPVDKLESSPSKLERSKSDRQRHLRPEDAAQIFNDKISVQEKVCRKGCNA